MGLKPWATSALRAPTAHDRAEDPPYRSTRLVRGHTECRKVGSCDICARRGFPFSDDQLCLLAYKLAGEKALWRGNYGRGKKHPIFISGKRNGCKSDTGGKIFQSSAAVG